MYLMDQLTTENVPSSLSGDPVVAVEFGGLSSSISNSFGSMSVLGAGMGHRTLSEQHGVRGVLG
jgi:hypothetical protein